MEKGEQGKGEHETRTPTEDPKWWCACGRDFPSEFARDMHTNTQVNSTGCHGLPLEERKRVGVAWVLLRLADRQVIADGRKRLPATGAENDYFTKAEGLGVHTAIQRVKHHFKPLDEVTQLTDSQSWIESRQTLAGPPPMRMRHIIRKSATGELCATHTLIRGLQESGVQWESRWHGAEHNIPQLDDERLSDESRCNRAVDFGAGLSAAAGRNREVDFYQPYGHPDTTPLDPFFFSRGQAVVMGDPQYAILQGGGAAAAARAAAAGGKAGRGIRAAM